MLTATDSELDLVLAVNLPLRPPSSPRPPSRHATMGVKRKSPAVDSNVVVESPKPSKRKQSKKKAQMTEAIGIEELDEIRKEGVQKHKMAANTRGSYGGYISRLQRWGRGTAGYELAFEGEPKESSPKALANYIALRCLKDGLGQSTADGAHAAWKKHWEEL